MGVRSKLRAILITDPLILLATAVMGSVSVLVSLFDPTGRAQHRIARAWSRMLLWISRAHVRVEGLEKISPGGRYVFAANHRSLMDIPMLLPTIPVEFRFMANHYLFKWPFIGYHLARAGHLAVNQGSVRDSLRSMSDAARVIATRGISVVIFPEAGRTEGELRPFKDGAAYIAIKAGVPLVPLGLTGMREILPIGSAFVTGGPVRMRIGDPIPTAGLTLHDRAALTQRLYGAVADLIDEPGAREDAPATERGAELGAQSGGRPRPSGRA
jgi:1-acyl-sn-glycerol-3-phosphate acyltransferase